MDDNLSINFPPGQNDVISRSHSPMDKNFFNSNKNKEIGDYGVSFSTLYNEGI